MGTGLTESKLLKIALVLLFAGSVLWWAKSALLGREEHWVHRLSEGTQKQIELKENNSIRQSFFAPADQLTGISFFSTQSKLISKEVGLTLYDKDNKEVARSFGVEPSYYTDFLKVTYLLHAPVQRGQQYSAVLIGSSTPTSFMSLENEVYKKDSLSVNDLPVEQYDLPMQVTAAAPTSFGVKQGIIVGILFLVGVLGINLLAFRFKRYQWFAAALLLMLIAPLAVTGLISSIGFWGISDWDYYFSLHHVWRTIVTEYHQFPLWNPYTCGGTAALADPEFSVLAPSFLLEFMFGVPLGLRLAAVMTLIVGAVGMLLLCKRLGLTVNAALLATVALIFGSVNLLEIVEGHPNIFASMWIPWIFWGWLGMYRGIQRPLWCGLFLALTFLQGGIYLLLYTLLAFLVLPWLTKHPWRAIKLTVVAGLWAAGFCAVKFWPVVFWLSEFPDKAYAGSTTTLRSIFEILFGRHLHGARIIPNQLAGWHEYGAYIGYFVFALGLVGLSEFKRNRVVRGLALAAVLATLLSSAGLVLMPLFDASPWLPRSMISRVILFAVLPFSILSGYGLMVVQKKLRFGKYLALVLVGAVAIDLMSLSYQLSEQAFVIPPDITPREAAPAPIAYTRKTSIYEVSGGEKYTRAYAAALAGYGSLNYCSVLGPKAHIQTIEDEGNSSVVSSDASKATVTLLSWSPNKVSVKVEAAEEAVVALNTNYATGWRVNGEPAQERGDRPTYMVQPGTHTLEFYYHTRGLMAGVIITVLTIAGAVFSRWVSQRQAIKL